MNGPDLDHHLAELRRLLALPRGRQPGALAGLRQRLPSPEVEPWNHSFGPGTLYEAWGRSTLMEGLYAANARTARGRLAERRGWVALEVGGGDGTLWARALPPDARGTLVLVDPLPEVHRRVAAALPPGVRLVSRVARIEEVAGELGEADLAVCSLSLHHVAGEDAARRAAAGLDGPGKAEVLAALHAALAPRDGLLVLNEADIYCDLELEPHDPVLVDRLLDSYVRRCARALADDIEGRNRVAADRDLRERWWAVIHRWCLDQVDAAERPAAERDVYELDVPRWLALLERAGFRVISRGFTDAYGLFCQYLCRP